MLLAPARDRTGEDRNDRSAGLSTAPRGRYSWAHDDANSQGMAPDLESAPPRRPFWKIRASVNLSKGSDPVATIVTVPSTVVPGLAIIIKLGSTSTAATAKALATKNNAISPINLNPFILKFIYVS